MTYWFMMTAILAVLVARYCYKLAHAARPYLVCRGTGGATAGMRPFTINEEMAAYADADDDVPLIGGEGDAHEGVPRGAFSNDAVIC